MARAWYVMLPPREPVSVAGVMPELQLLQGCKRAQLQIQRHGDEVVEPLWVSIEHQLPAQRDLVKAATAASTR